MTSEILIEPLTHREYAILAHLAEDKSNGEIAALELLALNSVKWYVRRIYAKLGVNKRSEAIERARDMGLLQPVPSASPVPSTYKNNLPAQMTSFIGRQKEIADLRHLLQKKETRLFAC
jgi:DNA-binding CsgD family transcriptional regulator